MGKASHFFSESVGFGTRAKLVINALMATMMAAFGESLVLAENVGLDPMKIIEVIGQGAIQVMNGNSKYSSHRVFSCLTYLSPCYTEPHVCVERSQDDSKRSLS